MFPELFSANRFFDLAVGGVSCITDMVVLKLGFFHSHALANLDLFDNQGLRMISVVCF